MITTELNRPQHRENQEIEVLLPEARSRARHRRLRNVGVVLGICALIAMTSLATAGLPPFSSGRASFPSARPLPTSPPTARLAAENIDPWAVGVQMLSATTGVAVELPNRKCGSDARPCVSWLVTTRDAWRHTVVDGQMPVLNAQQWLVAQGGAESQQPALAFSSTHLGWFAGPMLFQTSNGGRTWQRLRTFGAPKALSLSGDLLWVLEQRCVDPPKNSWSGPTGCTWALVSHRASESGPWRVHPIAASLVGANGNWGGWLQMGYRIGRSAGSLIDFGLPGAPHGAPGIIETTNGGASWRAITLPGVCTYWTQLLSVMFESSNRIVAYCQGAAAAGSATGVLIRTADNGRTWSWQGRISLDNCCGGPHGTVINEPLLLLSSNNGRNEWAMENTIYDVLESRNGGATWSVDRSFPTADPLALIVPVGSAGLMVFNKSGRPAVTLNGLQWSIVGSASRSTKNPPSQAVPRGLHESP